MTIDKIQLYNDDCLNILPLIPDNSVDAIICDLPYGVTNNKRDIIIPFDILWKEYKRITKLNSPIILFAQGIFYIDLVNSNRKMFKYDIIWDKKLKTGFLNAKRMPLRQHEQIAVFYKKLPTYNPQFVDGQPLHSKGKKYLDKEVKNNNYGNYSHTDDRRASSTKKYPSSIISIQKVHPSIAQHPTQKPVKLLEWLVKTYTNEGDVVLDNTMGVGTTGIACKNLNRKFIGIEINKEYFNIAKLNLIENAANVVNN